MNGHNRKRPITLSVYNTESESVPSFGVMALVTTEGMEDKYGRAVWKIKKPDADAAARQDPSLLFINGPVPIPAGHYGVGSQAWPVRAQLGTTAITDGDTCGPASGSWLATVGGTAFRLLANDLMTDSISTSLDLGWIWASNAPVIVPCSLTGDLNSGSSANATLLIGTARTTSGSTVVVHDVPAFITAGKKIASGVKLRIYYDSVISKYVLLTPAACEVAQ